MIVALCDDDTADAFAENFTLEVPPGTVSEDGTVTALLLLVRLTTIPPLDAIVESETVQLSVPGPTTDELAQVNAESDAVEFDPFP